MSILTPEQIEQLWQGEDDPYTFVWTPAMIRSVRDTIAAYAEVVQQLLDAVAALPIDYPESLEAAVKRAYALVGGDSQAKLIASLRGLV